jgi:putative membrane protein
MENQHMHNRTLLALLTGTAALAFSSVGWTQTSPTTGTTTSGSTTTEDRTIGTTTGSSTRGTTTATDTTPSAAGTSATSGTTGTTGTSSTTGTTGNAGTTSTSGRTASLADTDATFLRKATEGGREEVQRAQTAMRSAQRAEVRNVASMMLEDHRRTNDKLAQLASRKGWSVPSDAATAESDQARMPAAGPGFDDDYLEDEIRHHRETIALFRAQESTGSDPDLRQFARDTLPSLEHHLEMLQGSYSSN